MVKNNSNYKVIKSTVSRPVIQDTGSRIYVSLKLNNKRMLLLLLLLLLKFN